jgi:hypothetical protein
VEVKRSGNVEGMRGGDGVEFGDEGRCFKRYCIIWFEYI